MWSQFHNINLTYTFTVMPSGDKIEKWPCQYYNAPGNGYLNATCPYTWGNEADVTFAEVMLDRYFTDNDILE